MIGWFLQYSVGGCPDFHDSMCQRGSHEIDIVVIVVPIVVIWSGSGGICGGSAVDKG